MNTELNTKTVESDAEPYIEKISAIGMYWTVRDDKGLLLGNSCEELQFSLPDFVVIRSSIIVNNKPTIKLLCATPEESNLGTIEMELELELDKGVPPDYVDAKGDIVINDIADKQLVESLRHSSSGGRCGICGIKTKGTYLINYCCSDCYLAIRKSIRTRKYSGIKAISNEGLAFIRKLQGDNPNLCHICNAHPVIENSDVCTSCAMFISAGHPTQ